MRIAYLSLDRGIQLYGAKGASVHLQEFVQALAKLGHRVTVFTPQLGGPLRPPLGAEIVEVRPELISTADVPLVPGKEAVIVAEVRAMRLAELIQERVLAAHAESPFDLIYERYSLWSETGVRVAARLRVPCVVEVNAALVLEQRRYRELFHAELAEAIEAKVFRAADQLVVVSESLRAYVIARGAEAARTVVVPNGVDVTRFHPGVEPEALAGLDGGYVVGFCGSFQPWHGLDVLLEAFRRLAARWADVQLLLVGEGQLRGWIEGFIQGARLEGRVTVTGWVPYERIPHLIQRMDVCVAPYPPLEDFYFSPLKIPEYMAMGKPVVASRIGQIEQVIEDGVTGSLVPAGDPAGLAEGLVRVREEPGLAARLGPAAANRAREQTWEEVARRILAGLPAAPRSA